MRAVPGLLLALLLTVCARPSRLIGDEATPGHPPARRYSTADGLPHDTVYAVARDAQGYLWIGTQNGAARYDGRRFVTFDMPDAASSNYVRDLLAARDGSLWFARQNGGLVRMKNGASSVFGTAQGLATGRVNTVTEAPGPGGSLTIYAGLHAGGVYRLDGDRFVAVPSEGSPAWRVWKLLVAPRPGSPAGRPGSETRALLAASDEGLFALESNRFVRVPVPLGEDVRPSFNSLVATEENGATSLFLGSYGTGVFRWSGSRVDRFDVARGLSSNLVTSLAATARRGERPVVWVGTRGGGLARIDGESVRAVGLDPRASEVFGLASGLGDGALWVGVRAYGLLRLAETPFSTLDTWSGLPSDNVADLRVVPRAEGASVFIGTNRGLGIYRGGVVTVLDARNGLPGSEIGFLALTGNPARPDAWVATLTNGFVRFREGAPPLLLDTAHGFVTDRVFALLATPEGLWVGTDLGKIVLVDPETGKTLGQVDGLPRNEVLNLARTADGTLWAATRSGLAVIRDRTLVKVLTRADGLLNDEVLVLALVPGASGEELWAGTRGGVARLSLAGGDLRFSKVPGLPTGVDNAATQVILPDGHGNVYLGTHRGIVRLSEDGAAKVFTTADGIPSTIANWGGLVDGAGRVWISTSGGIAILDPELERRETGPPAPLVIQSILRNDRPVPVNDALTLGHDESVSLELALLSFSGGPVTYRAQIVGLDASASLAGASPVFRYTRLPAGEYVFRGWGRDERGTESGPVELSFRVAEAPWKTAPALAAYVLALGLGIAGFLWLRTAALHARARELEAVVEARTHELIAARDQALAGSRTKDAFLANVSHELRTPLNAILGYAELLSEELPGRADDSLEDVERIRGAAKLQLGLVNEILDLSKIEAGRFELHVETFPLDELVATVVSTVRTLVTKNGNQIAVKGSPGAGMLTADRTRLMQVLLNLLSNASKFTKGGVITLAVSRRPAGTSEEIELRVSDTGIGMTPPQLERLFQPFLQAEASTSANYGGTGLGLVIAKRFCELMGGDLTVESESGKGSHFTARIPSSPAGPPAERAKGTSPV